MKDRQRMSIESYRTSQITDSIFILGSVVVVCIIQTGCLPLENRWRRPLAIDSSQEDDWAPPKVNTRVSSYRYPQQFRSNGAKDVASRKTENNLDSHQNLIESSPAAYKPPASNIEAAKLASPVMAKSEKTLSRIHDQVAENSTGNSTGNSNTATSIVETEPKDLDLGGAIAALPPNLQVLLKQQLDALEKRGQETYSITSPKVASAEPEKKVSIRLSDQDQNQVVSKPIQSLVVTNAVETDKSPLANPVQQASAFVRSDAVGISEVITASATSIAEVPQSKTTSPTSQWNDDLSESIFKLEKSLKDNPSLQENIRISQEMTLRMLYIANRQLEEAMRPIEGLTEPERDYIQHQVQALYQASNPDPIPVKSQQWSLVMNSQRAATNQLAAVSKLDVKSVAFCTDVQGYGVVTKFPSNIFKPDQDLLLYCELDNVAADEVKDGFETQLQGSYEIIDPSGRRIADQLLPMEKEICKNHRRDYFIVYRIYTPMQIGPGNYQLRLTVEDMKAKKFGQTTLDFQIQK